MARSLRRHKKSKPVVKKRKNKKRNTKTDLPKEITTQAPDIKKKLGIEPVWDEEDHIEANYENMGFVSDLNAGTGRNRRVDIIAQKAAAIPDDEDIKDADLDDDLKVAMAKQRSTGKAPPKRPTPRQHQLVERLAAAHGSDVAAMVRDRKINTMQHSRGQIEALIESCEYWAGKTGVDFRVPNKRLW